MLRYLLHWEFKLEFFTPTHTRVADEELDRKEYDKNNLITITTLNFGIAKHTVRTTQGRNETERRCTILYLFSSFFFLLDFASKRKACCKSKNTIVTTKWKLRLWMKMQAGKHADKNKHARSRPTVKMQMQTANSNWNATLWSLLCSLKNSSLLIPPTRTYVASGSAMCARRSLFVYSML